MPDASYSEATKKHQTFFADAGLCIFAWEVPNFLSIFLRHPSEESDANNKAPPVAELVMFSSYSVACTNIIKVRMGLLRMFISNICTTVGPEIFFEPIPNNFETYF